MVKRRQSHPQKFWIGDSVMGLRNLTPAAPQSEYDYGGPKTALWNVTTKQHYSSHMWTRALQKEGFAVSSRTPCDDGHVLFPAPTEGYRSHLWLMSSGDRTSKNEASNVPFYFISPGLKWSHVSTGLYVQLCSSRWKGSIGGKKGGEMDETMFFSIFNTFLAISFSYPYTLTKRHGLRIYCGHKSHQVSVIDNETKAQRGHRCAPSDSAGQSQVLNTSPAIPTPHGFHYDMSCPHTWAQLKTQRRGHGICHLILSSWHFSSFSVCQIVVSCRVLWSKHSITQKKKEAPRGQPHTAEFGPQCPLPTFLYVLYSLHASHIGLLLEQQSKHTPTSGPLHQLFLHLTHSFIRYPHGTLLRSLLNCRLYMSSSVTIFLSPLSTPTSHYSWHQLSNSSLHCLWLVYYLSSSTPIRTKASWGWELCLVHWQIPAPGPWKASINTLNKNIDIWQRLTHMVAREVLSVLPIILHFPNILHQTSTSLAVIKSRSILHMILLGHHCVGLKSSPPSSLILTPTPQLPALSSTVNSTVPWNRDSQLCISSNLLDPRTSNTEAC